MHHLMRFFVALAAALISTHVSAEQSLPISFRMDLPATELIPTETMRPINNQRLLTATLKRESTGGPAPLRFAQAIETDIDLARDGSYRELEGGSGLWRLRVVSDSAVSLNLGFSRFELPKEARMWLWSSHTKQVAGPFTAENRSQLGRFWTPILQGGNVIVEIHVPAPSDVPDVRLSTVNHGFRDLAKISGSCNNDVVCPEADPWRDQIRSVARYSINGTSLCSGSLINNTSGDQTPYFLTAFHCGVSSQNADTVVVYWNYESPVCGDRSGGSLGFSQSGSTYRAGHEVSDMLLLELNQTPPAAFNLFYTGWDASGNAPAGSVGIHHPRGDVKAITFNTDPLETSDIVWIEPGTHWKVAQWEDGTTEGGSSGSCLWDPDSKLCVGWLSGGAASCSNVSFDVYGKMSAAWNGNGTPPTRLRDWLDPMSTGMLTLQGVNASSALLIDGFEGPDPGAGSEKR